MRVDIAQSTWLMEAWHPSYASRIDNQVLDDRLTMSTNITIALPAGSTNHGDPNLLCVPPTVSIRDHIPPLLRLS